MQTISYILSAIVLILMTTASLLKGKDVKKILFLVFAGNFFAALSYLVTGAINGAAACFVGAAMTIINFFFSSKGKKIPHWLSAIYIVAISGVNILVADSISISVILVILAGVIFVLSVGVENGKMFRFWTMINFCIWIVYDILLKTWGPFGMHTIQLIATIVSMVVFDRKKQKMGERK